MKPLLLRGKKKGNESKRADEDSGHVKSAGARLKPPPGGDPLAHPQPPGREAAAQGLPSRRRKLPGGVRKPGTR